MCSTRHLAFLIRLAVLLGRLQIRESTLGPLRLERSFRCPAFAPTVGLATCRNKLSASTSAAHECHADRHALGFGDTCAVPKQNQSSSDRSSKTHHRAFIACFSSSPKLRVNFCPKALLGFTVPLEMASSSCDSKPSRSTCSGTCATVKFCSRQLAPRSTSRPGSSHT